MDQQALAGPEPPRPKTLLQTVKKVSQSPAAARMSSPAGTGSAWSWWVSANSA